jgi:hypothetical protein
VTGLACRSRSPVFAFFAFLADEYNVLARCKYKYNPFFEQDRYLPAVGRRALLTFRGTAVEILGDPSDLGLRDQWQRRLRKQYAYITCGTHGGSMLRGSKSSVCRTKLRGQRARTADTGRTEMLQDSAGSQSCVNGRARQVPRSIKHSLLFSSFSPTPHPHSAGPMERPKLQTVAKGGDLAGLGRWLARLFGVACEACQ